MSRWRTDRGLQLWPQNHLRRVFPLPPPQRQFACHCGESLREQQQQQPKNKTKPSSGTVPFGCWAGQNRRGISSPFLSLSLCLYVCLSDDDTRAFFLFANLRQREGTPSSAGVKEGRDEQLPFTGPRGGRGQIRGTTTNRFRVPPGWYTILDFLSLSEAPITTLRL